VFEYAGVSVKIVVVPVNPDVLPCFKVKEDQGGPTIGHFLLHHSIVNVLYEALMAIALHILVACVACEMTTNVFGLATSTAFQQLIAVLAAFDKLANAADFALFSVWLNKLCALVIFKALGTQKPAIALVTLDMTGWGASRTGVAAQTVAAFTSMITAKLISLVTIRTPVVGTHEARHAGDDVKMAAMQQQVDNFVSRRT